MAHVVLGGKPRPATVANICFSQSCNKKAAMLLPPLVLVHLLLESVFHLLLPRLLLSLLFPQAIHHSVFDSALWLVFEHALVEHPAAGDQEGEGHGADQQSSSPVVISATSLTAYLLILLFIRATYRVR